MWACSRQWRPTAASRGRSTGSPRWSTGRRRASKCSNATCRCCFPAPRRPSAAPPPPSPIAIASGALGAEIRRVLERERPDAATSRRSSPPKTRRSASRPPTRTCEPSRCWRRRLGGPLAAATCVAVEDSPWGLQSARAAGLRTVAVAHAYDRVGAGRRRPGHRRIDRRARHRSSEASLTPEEAGSPFFCVILCAGMQRPTRPQLHARRAQPGSRPGDRRADDRARRVSQARRRSVSRPARRARPRSAPACRRRRRSPAGRAAARRSRSATRA